VRLCVIPARGGSKRIPKKNIKLFCGKPIIAYSIDAAKRTGCFDRIIVSTDDDEIASIASGCGAEVPFIRPKSLADDFSGTIPVIKHAIEYFRSGGLMYEYVCCVYATAPFVRELDILSALEKLEQGDLLYSVPFTRYRFPIQRAVKINERGRVEMFFPENFNTRSQDLEESWHDAGQFYWGMADAWLAEKPIFSSDTWALSVPSYRVQDIDNMDDWKRAEAMYRALLEMNEI